MSGRGNFPRRGGAVSVVPDDSISVFGLGQCSLDFLGEVTCYPGVDEKAEMNASSLQGGGPVATALVTLSRLGIRTAFSGRLGDDDFGLRILSGLEEEGVDCSWVQTVPGAISQHAYIIAEQGTGARNIFWHRGTCPPLSGVDIDEAAIGGTRILLLDGLQLEASICAASIARERGVVTVLDGGTLRPGVEDLLPLIDHPVVSQRFAEALVPGQPEVHALEVLLRYGGRAATVTLGQKGSVSMTAAGERIVQKAFTVTPVDTTGCGDVFHGGYVYGLLMGWSLPQVLRFASACAALKTRALGGRAAIPGIDEVEAFLLAASDR